MNIYKSTTHKERYYHFIRDDTLPGIHSKIKAVTAFAREEPAGDKQHWYISMAFCLEGDQFERKTGRQIARRKYFNFRRFYLGKEITYDKIVEVARKELARIDGKCQN